jgi:outer membrane protein OmpA-like peptidoglycan-associated protein
MGLGEDSPLVANDSAANKAKNRRVEIVMRSR